MSRQRSIRSVLVTYLSAAIFLLGGLIWWVMYLGERQLVEGWCDDAIQLQLRLADERLKGFFDPVSRDVELLREMGNRGQLEPDTGDALQPLFSTLLSQNPHVSAVIVADERGHEFSVARNGQKWTSRQLQVDEWGGRQLLSTWGVDVNAAGTQAAGQYDPRTRPWFREAVEDDEELHWTRPYRFFQGREPGITASARFQDAQGRTCVVALDVKLRELQEFTRSIHVGSHGTMMILDGSGWPIDAPAKTVDASIDFSDSPTAGAQLLGPKELSVTRTLESSAAPSGRAIRVVHEGRVWWADAKYFPLAAGRAWQVVVMVPEQDFTQGLSTIRYSVAGVTIVVLLLAAAGAVWFADHLSRPLESLVAAMNRISRGDLGEPTPVPSRLREVGELTTAQERMRVALRSLLKLEHDMKVARQIQQSTFPSRFPQLKDYQIAGWSEPADETGGDTFDVIPVWQRSNAARTAASEHDPPQAVYLLLADVSGHGIGAALSAVRIHLLFRFAVDQQASVNGIVNLVNRHVCDALTPSKFATAWVARLDPVQGVLESFSAGQGPLFWLHAATNHVEMIKETDGLPWGVSEGAARSAGRTLRLEPGDIVAVVSDGILEAADGDQNLGAARVAALLEREQRASAADILRALRLDVDAYTGGADAVDDRTVLIVKRERA